MGLNMLRPPYVEKLHGVEVTETRRTIEGRPIIRRTFSTPVGSVYEDEFREAGTGQWKLMRSWKGNQAWITARMIKGPEDSKVVKYMVEHTEYTADYSPIEQAMEWLGEEGVVLDGLPHSPMQMKYFMPEYEKQARPLHRHGKLMAVHMDGRVADLKHLIAPPIDIVEALHPIPMGDLSIGEALALWKDKAIWLGSPGAIYELGTPATREFAVQLLREIGSGERLALAMSTENQVSNDNLLALTSILENLELPLQDLSR
jgi:hypothetical protein